MDQRRNQRGNEKYLEIHKNGNTTYKNLWDAAKVVLRGKFIATNTNIKEIETISNKQPKFILQGTKKEEQMNPNFSRRRKYKNQNRGKWNRDEKDNIKKSMKVRVGFLKIN